MNYNSTLYETRPVKFSDYMSNKYNIVHTMLYEDAIDKYLNSIIENIICGKFTYKLFEMFNNYFTIHNDQMTLDPNNENNIINLSVLNEYDIDKVFTMDEIFDSNIIQNQDYLNDLISYVQTNEIINVSLNSLDLNKEYKDKYIVYVLVNTLFLLFRFKKTIADNFNTLTSISEISDFIIRYQNSIYMIDEKNEYSLVRTEDNNSLTLDEVFIYEEMLKENFHIGYTIDGKWILDLDPSVDLSDEDIKNRMLALISKTNYNLWNMLKYNLTQVYLRYHKIIEKKASEYYKPSTILIINKIFPYSKKTVDLTPWWNTYQEYKQHTIENIITAEKEKLKDGVLEEINYINGTAKVYSKQNDQTYTVDLNCIKDNTEINDDLLSFTFAYKLNELNTKNILSHNV